VTTSDSVRSPVPSRMSTAAPISTAARMSSSPVLLPFLLLVGFVAAVALRSLIGGVAVARSAPAGLAFAALLVGLCALASAPGACASAPAARASVPVGPTRRESARFGSLAGSAVSVLAGVVGATVLCLPALVHRLGASDTPTGRSGEGFLAWALVVAVVAAAEEGFLRGTLYRLLVPFGSAPAIGIPAIAFAALHLPLYGWGALPLDLAVGVWLGALRAVTGSALAPAVSHVLADWAAWALL
jgi:hypothetical protein